MQYNRLTWWATWILAIFMTSCVINYDHKTTEDEPKKNKNMNKDMVVTLSLDGILTEQMSGGGLVSSLTAQEVTTSVQSVVNFLEELSQDDNVSILVLDLLKLEGGSFAAIDEVLGALQKVKKSGKTIYSYGVNYRMTSFLLAQVSDEIWLDPMGDVALDGLASGSTYYKDILDKYGLVAYVARVGKYKSAVEPYMQSTMSDDVRSNTMNYLNDIWQIYLERLYTLRNLDKQLVENYVSQRPELLVQYDGDAAKLALDQKLVQKIGTYQDVLSYIEDELGYGNMVEASKYQAQMAEKKQKNKKKNSDQIAVVYASGMIVEGESSKDTMGSDTIVALMEKVLANKNNKALVLRINSGGGDVFASETIARAVEKVKKTMPVIISMGSVAASGAYWISLSADEIWADETALTGSIGVFSLFINAEPLATKQGIKVERLSTHDQAGQLSLFAQPQPSQLQMMQSSVNFIYKRFLDKVVAAGRSSDVTAADALAQGQIYSGLRAHKLGLVQNLGGLEQVIQRAAEKSELADYDVKVYHTKPSLLQQILMMMSQVSQPLLLKDIIARNAVQDPAHPRTYAWEATVVQLP